MLLFFAGVNGCGKTTMYYDELEKGNIFDYRINIDEIVSSFGDWRNSQDQIRAAKIAKERVKLRVSKGGHDIKPELIERRFYLSLQNFHRICFLCDNVVVFDNTQGFEKLLEKQGFKDYKHGIESFIDGIKKNKK